MILKTRWTLALALCLIAVAAQADIVLFDYGFNINSTLFPMDEPLPMSLDDEAFNWATGLGELTFSFDPGESRDFSVLSFFDHEIDAPDNSYFNEYGVVYGTPDKDLTWEIDEPGYLFGDIYDNLTAGAYDNTNAIYDWWPDDVSMGMGWEFSLDDDQWAEVTFSLSESMPSDGFFLGQHDVQSDQSIYFSSTLNINSPMSVPEPGTAAMLLCGLVLVAAYRAPTQRHLQ